MFAPSRGTACRLSVRNFSESSGRCPAVSENYGIVVASAFYRTMSILNEPAKRTREMQLRGSPGGRRLHQDDAGCKQRRDDDRSHGCGSREDDTRQHRCECVCPCHGQNLVYRTGSSGTAVCGMTPLRNRTSALPHGPSDHLRLPLIPDRRPTVKTLSRSVNSTCRVFRLHCLPKRRTLRYS